ncbi:MAG: hypothetical protein AB8B47_04970 [Roseobacter sp.]
MSSTPLFPVRRRRVFYLPGYDPFPPRRYRELYRTEAALQGAISNYDIRMSGQTTGQGYGWRVHATIDDQPTETDIEVLVWSDIVQDSRPAGILATYADLFRTAWIYMTTGALWRLMRLRKGPVIAALYPVVALLAQALTAAALGWAMLRIVHRMGQELLSPDAQGIGLIAGGVVGITLSALVLRWFRDNDGKFFAYYLMHDFAYSAALNGAYTEPLERRLTAFRARIAQALSEEVDEVLIVGHSSGAHLGVSILSDLISAGEVPDKGPSLAFLSLGHVVPMVSFLPDAHRLRRDLHYLSQRPEVTWVDVTAPGDGCCFALCDPVAVSGQATQDKCGPLVFSAAFTQSLSPARWKALRWRFFRLHFQYLCAFDQPKDYDYFQITAGPVRLADRYVDRPASKSRIDHAVSKYTATDP